jgi:multimeric flavodoxin WrbA
MKRALYLNGSPHKNGATAKILKMVQEKLQGSYTTEWVNVYDLSVAPCRGCVRCRPNGVCILPEDGGQRVGRMIAEADLIVVGSPVYWGNITAPLKLVFDRNVTTFEHFLNGGPTPKLTRKEALIVVAGGTDSTNHEKPNQGGGAVQAVRTVLESGGIRVAGTVNLYSAWDFERLKPETEEMVNRAVAGLEVG